jgi:hypothetical protein
MKKVMLLLVTALMWSGIILAQRPEAVIARMAASGELGKVKESMAAAKKQKAVKPVSSGCEEISLEGFSYEPYLQTDVEIWEETYSVNGTETEWSNFYVPIITLDGYTFDHYSAKQTPEYPYIYDYWDGFTLSLGGPVPDDDPCNMDKQFSAVTSTDSFSPYLVAYYSYNEDFYTVNPCNIKFPEPKIPCGAYFTNNHYTLEGMLNGDCFASAFGAGDSLWLVIEGHRNDTLINSKSFNLAKYNSGTSSLEYFDEWQWVCLKNLGTVDSLSFKLYTTDSGEWGPNTPMYFCMAGLKVSDSIGTICNGNPPAITCKKMKTEKNIQVYPNPASSEITLNAGEGSLVEIFDLSGFLKKSRIFKADKETIPVKNLQNGLYTIRITSGDKIEMVKFYKN